MYIWDIHHGASTTFENARWVMGFCLFLASLNGELIVFLERFIYIRFPYHYTNWICKKYIAAATFWTQWFIAVALTLPLAFTRTPLYSVFYIAVLIAAIVSLHLYIYCFARQESQKIARQYPRRVPAPKNASIEQISYNGCHGSVSNSVVLGPHRHVASDCATIFTVFQALCENCRIFYIPERCSSSFHFLLEAAVFSQRAR